MFADNIEDAKRNVEFFIGNPSDCSTKKHREQYHFKIGEIEMVMNEAFEAEAEEEFEF